MVGITGDPLIAIQLNNHPRFHQVEERSSQTRFQFGEKGALREIEIGNTSAHEYGLVELIDNNPLVCADSMSLPTLPVSVALVCLGPLFLAGIVQEEPILVINAPFDAVELDAAFSRLGWTEGVLTRIEEFSTPGVIVASASAVIATPEDPEDLADLFEERFGRSLLIDSDVTKEWTPELVQGRPSCAYRIVLNGEGDTSLVTVRVMCDATGAYQSAQVVNAMNIMAGFEDSLGLNL